MPPNTGLPVDAVRLDSMRRMPVESAVAATSASAAIGNVRLRVSFRGHGSIPLLWVLAFVGTELPIGTQK